VAANPDPETCKSQGSQAGAEVVTSDEVRIAGWYIPAANGAGPDGPTLVIAPGRKSNKSDALKYAPPFHETFNLVLVDLRNGGRSGDALTSWGYLERLDVRAMVDWLVRTKDPSWIGAMGNSAGAASVLAAAAEDPRIRALILDSMHGSVVTTLADGIESENHVPGYPTAWAIGAVTSARIGADLTVADPVRTITQLGDRPVLLLHGTADRVDRPEHSADRTFAAAQAAGVPVELHYCEGATHGAVIDKCTAAWAAWVDAFLAPLVGPVG
jgi:pimeloyl-ACP methyl ester carboxylesterase